MPAGKVIEHVWEPTERQLAVMQIIADLPVGGTAVIGYGGAAGGGKSNLIVNLAQNIALSVPGSRLLVGRQDFLDLKDTTLRFFDSALPPGVLVDKYDSAPVSRTLSAGGDREPSVVMFRGLDDWQSLMSDEFGWVFIDEGNEVPLQAIMGLLTRLRHRPEKKWGVVVGFNPFPSWCVDWFIDGLRPSEFRDNPLVQIHFVQSLMDDNPHLREGYKEMLEQTLDPYMRAVMVEGKAEMVPHAVFPTLQANRHWLMQPWDAEKDRLTKVGIGVDWGTTVAHQSAMVLAGESKDGTVWVLDAWMSPMGSSKELAEKAGEWKGRKGWEPTFVRYDRSQGSLKDILLGTFRDVQPGIRDVDGRIRAMRGFIDRRGIRFNANSEGVKLLWRQMVRYHRDDDDKIVEEQDDLVDAGLYVTSAFDPRISQMQAQTNARIEYAGAPRARQAAGYRGLG